MKEKLSELSIGCPECNDREHRMTIIIGIDLASGKDYSVKSYFIQCDKCETKFKLVQTEIIEEKNIEPEAKIDTTMVTP